MKIANLLFTNVNSTNYVMIAFYWIGIIACVASGYEKGKRFNDVPLVQSLLNCFAGGVFRDSIALETNVWLFTYKAIPDVVFSIFICFAYSLLSKRIGKDIKEKIVSNIVTIFDVCGLASLVCLAEDKAFLLGKETFIAIISGYLTCCFGGIIANYMHPTAILRKSNVYYQCIVFLGCVLYCFIPNGFVICIFIAMGLMLENVKINNFMQLYLMEIQERCSKFRSAGNASYTRHKFYIQAKCIINSFYKSNYSRIFIMLHKFRFC